MSVEHFSDSAQVQVTFCLVNVLFSQRSNVLFGQRSNVLFSQRGNVLFM